MSSLQNTYARFTDSAKTGVFDSEDSFLENGQSFRIDIDDFTIGAGSFKWFGVRETDPDLAIILTTKSIQGTADDFTMDIWASTSNSGGTDISNQIANRNGISSNTPVLEIFEDATVIGGQKVFGTHVRGVSGQGNNPSFTTNNMDDALIFGVDVEGAIRVDNLSGSAAQFDLTLVWAEVLQSSIGTFY